ncbi:DUF1178 family protein [Sphingomonas sp. S1-29]|uniref:DUF1178 family protein n=1 Tax=Sphingomonas qomolangmaensis TaxID=2918765 RepID=A0ABY5L2W2_9SPHN|nr:MULTISPECIES: DUF1178 family protein [Sphingomonas]UUL81279.1 DUF1178 family protein [Sphingomonas qomolangmaensis]UZK70728.1 DUF1178 family protein [Sphingomonas sp. S1-29]
MIVFDLRCPAAHVFEAWFGSSAAYADQRERGLIACPICGDTDIQKALMAPNIGAKGNRAVAPPPKPAGDAPTPEAIKAAIATVAAAQAKMLEQSAWVGRSFPDRARAMHLGEEKVAPIHGQATLAEARALVDEGVAIAPLPFPVVPPSAQN